MNDLISVIIPVYNNAQYLERCLESVVSQTYRNLEIIIVNDGSQDRSAEIIECFSSRDHRIIAIHQKNQGVSAARNAGLAIAKGNCIGFVDADDEVHPDMYEFLYHNLEKYEVDISHCGFELVKSDPTVKFHDTGIVLVQNKVEALKELLAGDRVEPSTCNKLFKMEILKKIRFAVDIKINEDLLFNVEAFNNAQRSIFEDVVKYKYHHNPVSASRSSKILFIQEEVYKAAQKIRLLLQDDEMKEAVEKFYVTKLLTSLKSLKKHHLFASELAKRHRTELKQNTTKKLGLRVSILKNLLVYFPFFYHPFIYFYDMLFAKNQKWK
ncbi:glycosyltransferase [Chryseobacterium sp. MDT2-18]|uniref:glycosyltransferase family 2 protein n=1 Tax=Chryseobacterium sp. MDT2-18 TaxID=1259136 RepID=UPI00278251D9|nr:glycosyltransferase [Chryseobacterium sp. MDT2-18]MDQ0478174.1 glycosyltransferase involved in cell wall biosynthesis [Chryseobacterium sp. MDT2-18]